MRRCHLILAVLFVAVCGCATTSGMSRSDVIEMYPQLASLHAALLDAEMAGATLLAPTGYAEARKQLDIAIAAAQSSKKDKAITAASRGMSAIATTNASLAAFREAMDEVLETRERALVAGARNLYSDELNKAERQIRELAKKAESNGIPSVLDKRPELLALYSDLELKSLKKGSVEGAKAAIAQAEKSGAEKWAPKTFKLAREQIKLVTGVLDADRTQTAKAQAHAAKTIWLAGQAMAITTLAKKFDAENFTLEDILLWYHGQLEEISQPLGEPIPLDKDNRELVLAMRDDIAALKKGLEDTREVMKQYQDQVERVMEGSKKQRANMEIAMREVLNADRKDLVSLRKKYAEYLSVEGKTTAMSEERDVELKRIAEEIKKSFDEDEASVSLRDGNVLIILHGVEFGKNKVDISARSFGLLNKVALAVQELPDCDIEISGHTDARGRVAKNIEISQQRADAIMKFLTEVGGVETKRIKAQGLGSSKPISNNNTAEGRRQNRRVEVLLVNE